MKNITLGLWLLLAALTGLWLLSDNLWPQPFGYFPFRTAFMQLSGIIAIGAMSVAILLALRPKWLEPTLGGLDKMYRLHKWLGITALVASVLHWWFGQGSQWMVGWGWLIRPPRGPAPELTNPIEQFLRGQRGLAESLGEWAFYAAVILLALALIKRFPYHLFFKTHRLLAIVYLIFVYHSVVLMKFAYWSAGVGWILALLMAGGAVAAVMALLRRIGANRQISGVIETLIHYPELQVLESAIRLNEGWPGHQAGQFAFVTSRPSEGAHPYTIASAWNNDGRIVFITKALGDHTRALPERLKVGDAVKVEGPYGCFNFQSSQPRQIWIGAGIGITPFIARLKHLAQSTEPQEIDLFHPTADYAEAAIAKLKADAQAANVRLHLRLTHQDGRLDAAQVRAIVPEWQSASIWFCGPSAFGQALRQDFIMHGLAAHDFHQELFEMR